MSTSVTSDDQSEEMTYDRAAKRKYSESPKLTEIVSTALKKQRDRPQIRLFSGSTFSGKEQLIDDPSPLACIKNIDRRQSTFRNKLRKIFLLFRKLLGSTAINY